MDVAAGNSQVSSDALIAGEGVGLIRESCCGRKLTLSGRPADQRNV
jgi:hypothetical protein